MVLMCELSPGSSICLAAVPALYRAKARSRQVEGGKEVEEGREVLEIYTSFRPETTTYITADKLDQVCQTIRKKNKNKKNNLDIRCTL